MEQPAYYPYVFLGGEPIGSIALQALTERGYAPVASTFDTKLGTEELCDFIEENRATFVLVVGYGKILKQEVLDTVAGQVINLHPSFLPAYRGPAPVVQAILDGARETGISVMELDRYMDHGPIIAATRYPITGTETTYQLYETLIRKGVNLLLENIEEYLSGELEPMPQLHFEATITHFVKKSDGKVSLQDEPEEICRKIRAYEKWPTTWTILPNGKRLILHAAHVAEGKLVLDTVQPEGKAKMSFEEFLRGSRMKAEELGM